MEGFMYLSPVLFYTVMTLVWAAPLYVFHLSVVPSVQNINIHLFYLLIFTNMLIFAIGLSVFVQTQSVWRDLTYWGKYCVLCTIYTTQIGVTIAISVLLGSNELLTYFGTETETSMGLVILLPSPVIYFLTGYMFKWGKEAVEKFPKRWKKTTVVSCPPEIVAYKSNMEADNK